jgi:trans-2,3-dihydro-3-hydroxyanthranilate isomerase
MFTRSLCEDPATGRATAAAVALLPDLSGGARLALELQQGVGMGRPGLLRATACARRAASPPGWPGTACR